MNGFMVVTLGLVLAVTSVPIQQKADHVQLEKRAQEAIMFGNQQNAPRNKKKKSDPAMPALADRNDVDQGGKVKVLPPSVAVGEAPAPGETPVGKSTAQSSGSEAEMGSSADQIANVENKLDHDKESKTVSDHTSAENVKTSDLIDNTKIDDQPSAPAAADKNINVASEIIDDTPPEVNTEQQQPPMTEVATVDQDVPKQIDSDDDDDDADMQSFNKYLSFYDNDLKPPKNYEPVFLPYYGYRRRRSSQHSGSSLPLKRAKRIKRDLLDDEEAYLYQYGRPDEYPDNAWSPDEDVYENYLPYSQQYNPDLADLLSLYEEERKPAYENVESYLPYTSYPQMEEDQDDVFAPSKRQMLSMLPGIKRKRYFYPFATEPRTHWGAFVPRQQKRDYDETYTRLLRLARALDNPYY